MFCAFAQTADNVTMRSPCTFWLNMIILTTNSFYYLTVYFVLPIPIKLHRQIMINLFLSFVDNLITYHHRQRSMNKTSWYSKSCLLMTMKPYSFHFEYVLMNNFILLHIFSYSIVFQYQACFQIWLLDFISWAL